MQKPRNYDRTSAFGEFTPLELGGHVCKIIKVEETTSSTDRPMIKIALDIAEGKQKDYYRTMFDKDDRPDKKWGCVVYQLIEDRDGNTSKGFKTFIESVKKSNKGFNEDAIWDDNFASYFKGKLIGGVFGREQYKANDGKFKWSTKCVQFRSVDVVREGVEVPEDKYHKDYKNIDITCDTKQHKDFEEIIDDDDDLPF